MKVSPNGGPILSGTGLQQVKERIQQRFAEARECGATSLVPKKVVTTAKAGQDAQVVNRAKSEQKARRTLEEKERLDRRDLAEDRLLEPLREPVHEGFEFFVEGQKGGWLHRGASRGT